MKIITNFKSIELFETDRMIAKRITADDLDKLICCAANLAF